MNASTAPVLDRPTSVEEGVELLERFGDDAAPIAGGTELVMLLRLGLSSALRLVDISRIPALRQIETSPTGGIRIGSAVTHAEVHTSERVRQLVPAMASMAASVGNVRVQSSGTIGGNLCFADPQSDVSTLLMTARARIACAGPRRTMRVVEVEDFLKDAYTADRAPTELVVWVDIPVPPPQQILRYSKIAFRERPDVGCGISVEWSSNEEIHSIRGVIGALTPVPVRLEPLTELLGRRKDSFETSELRDIAHSCVQQTLPRALRERRTPHMESVATTLLAQVLSTVLHPEPPPSGHGTRS